MGQYLNRVKAKGENKVRKIINYSNKQTAVDMIETADRHSDRVLNGVQSRTTM
jgi:hypothetical protein